MWNEFKAFALKGNMLELAVGVIIGASFGKVTSSLVNDILMPPLGKLVGNIDFQNIFINLSEQHYPTLAQAKAAGVPTINVGLFLNQLIDFFIVSFAVFLLLRYMNRLFHLKKNEEPVLSRQEVLLTEIRDLLKNRS